MFIGNFAVTRFISIHALREESDTQAIVAARKIERFQSTPSARRATAKIRRWKLLVLNFNPRPPRGERLRDADGDTLTVTISIHALREESDQLWGGRTRPLRDFNPRPPRGERPEVKKGVNIVFEFQSTPSARRATKSREELQICIYISIHALREESDSLRRRAALRVNEFQSTPSARRATMPRSTTPAPPTNFNPRPPRGERHNERLQKHDFSYFNPRPPRGERPTAHTRWFLCINFNPRPPRGERLYVTREDYIRVIFQSTPSARRATVSPYRGDQQHAISIHALREESDLPRRRPPAPTSIFQSTPSARRATRAGQDMAGGRAISIHALREESDERPTSWMPML